MFLEALAALADDLSYTQDRIAAEASLENATQRRSVVRMARLVDYEPSPALSASVLLQFDVTPGTETLPGGLPVTASGPDGTPIPFEVGTSLASWQIDPTTHKPNTPPPAVNPLWNRGVIRPYWFDDSRRCLRAGATSMYVLGWGFNFVPGQPLLIETAPPTTADLPIRQIVHLIDGGTESSDPLYAPRQDPTLPTCDLLYVPTQGPTLPPSMLASTESPGGTALTLIQWEAGDALTDDRDLCLTTIAGNLITATQGLTQPAESFSIPGGTPPPPPGATLAIVRTGPNDTPADPSLQYLYTLPSAPMAWLTPADPTQYPHPEIVLTGPAPGSRSVAWNFGRWLLDSAAYDSDFTVDPARYSRIAGITGDTIRHDYDGDAGDTIRFGDGVFGAAPEPGWAFKVLYRTTAGSAGNVAADTITSIDPGTDEAGAVIRVTNPMPAAGGADPEPLDAVRRLAPQAFRAVQYRAVLPSDYQAAAETLPWVERAGTVFRWTGSWLTVFTTPDPLASEQATVEQRQELIRLLNRYRMAGYESYVPDAEYVSVDLIVQVCALSTAFRGDVEQAVLTALGLGAGRVLRPPELHLRPAAGEERPGGGRAGVQRRSRRDLRPLSDPRPHARLHPDGRFGRRGHGPDHPVRQRPEPGGEWVAPDPRRGGQMSCCPGDEPPICPCGPPAFPLAISNPPGLAAIAYRVGDYTSFRRALLLPRSGETQLTRLVDSQVIPIWRPGTQGDLAAQMVEWWAYLCDILTFYNERIANEAYLRTADLPESVNRLIVLLGYRPRPGIGAIGTLAALATGTGPFTLPAGFQVQSKPGPGQQPQVFELSAAVTVTPPVGPPGTAASRGTAGVQTPTTPSPAPAAQASAGPSCSRARPPRSRSATAF